jgi:hypothetical protein
LTTARSLADAEEAVLQRLAELRQAVIEGAGQAADLNALRTILKQLFDRVLLLSADHPWLKLDEVRDAAATLPGLVLLPCLREDVVTMAEDGRTLFDRAVLPLAESAYEGLPSWAVLGGLFGPVPLSMPDIGGRPENSPRLSTTLTLAATRRLELCASPYAQGSACGPRRGGG